MDESMMPDRTMTPLEIRDALSRLVPDALGLIERSMRTSQGRQPSRACLDCAWRLVDLGLSAETAEPKVDRDVAQLAEVLAFVGG